LFTSNTAWGIGEEIKNGQITGSILKPLGYLGYKFSQSVGALLYRMLFFVPVIALVLFLLRNLSSHPAHEFDYLFFLVLAILGFILNFLIYYIVGLATFWMGDGYGFFFACMVVVSFMQGQWMPLDLLPRWIAAIGDFLPFKYLFFVPVAIASGRMNFNYLMLIIPMVWIFAGYLFAQFLYKKGIRKYEGYGA
jgi:ABC-2 type transport system permease protein